MLQRLGIPFRLNRRASAAVKKPFQALKYASLATYYHLYRSMTEVRSQSSYRSKKFTRRCLLTLYSLKEKVTIAFIVSISSAASLFLITILIYYL